MKTAGNLTPGVFQRRLELNGMLMFNTPLDTAGYWKVNTFTNVNYAIMWDM